MRYILLLLVAVAILSCRAKKADKKDRPAAPFTVEFPNAHSVNSEKDFCITINKTLCNDCFKASLYNRWGELVWQAEKLEDCWNGNHYKTDLPLPEGVYYINVKTKYKGEEFNNNGTVTLIR